MKQLFSFLFFLLFIGPFIIAQEGEYQLIFAEEFNAPQLDRTRWNVQTGYAANQEKQYYTDDPSTHRIEDGVLVISAHHERAVPDREYTSARIHTQGKVHLLYGKIEASISLPVGRGTWPAFWMMPQDDVYGRWPNSGEIDIMEHVGSDPRMISHAVHTALKNGSKGNNWQQKTYRDDVENSYHLYGVEWMEDRMLFYVDGEKTATLYRNLADDYRGWPFDSDFYVILNLAIGGTMGGSIDNTIFDAPVEMKVDYVRMYQKKVIDGLTSETAADTDYIHCPIRFDEYLAVTCLNPCTLQLYDVSGRLWLTAPLTSDAVLDTTGLPSGLYIARANDQTVKLIK